MPDGAKRGVYIYLAVVMVKFQKKTQNIIEQARQILTLHHPMTVRQVYYQLVSRQIVENNRNRYQAVSDALVKARKQGLIDWEWIEDRLRRPRHVRRCTQEQ